MVQIALNLSKIVLLSENREMPNASKPSDTRCVPSVLCDVECPSARGGFGLATAVVTNFPSLANALLFEKQNAPVTKSKIGLKFVMY